MRELAPGIVFDVEQEALAAAEDGSGTSSAVGGLLAASVVIQIGSQPFERSMLAATTSGATICCYQVLPRLGIRERLDVDALDQTLAPGSSVRD